MAKVVRALISVSDKTGVLEFARGLYDLGVELISTGGTAKLLHDAGIPVRGISDLTGFPEMLDGRVKTLHPKVHGGLLARRDLPEHMETIAAHEILPIDLLCVNLYPFAATVARPEVTLEDAIENIDIGGPAMVRSASKNHDAVTVLTRAADYMVVLDELRTNGGATTLATRRRLAAAAFAHTARYDSMIAGYLSAQFTPEEPYVQELTVGFERAFACRYGENPHQSAAFYKEPLVNEPCIGTSRQLHGKELSFNNLFDLNAALETVKEFDEAPAAVIIKHANPCGVALGIDIAQAFERAKASDPVSAFGGILAVNMPVDASAAELITGKNTFFEAIVAPGFTADALPILTGKKAWGANLRLLEVGSLEGWRKLAAGRDLKRVVGGLLVQERDLKVICAEDLKCVTERCPTDEEIAELLFAWRVAKHVKSNAIVLTKDRQVVGVGAGQMNRVQSVRLASGQAGDQAGGAAMASDAFFPFPDGPEHAIRCGVRAIIQPGGSRKDQETIDVCNANGVTMVYTGVRHFLH